MEKERRVKWLVIVSLIVAVLGLTIAFAALSETLTINGTATLDAAKWGIKFNNLTSGTKIGDAIVNNEATIADDKVTIENIDVTLKTPGDSVTYKVNLVNEGTINAEISNIKVPELTEEQKRYIEFKVTYDTGEEVTQGDILNSGATKNLTIKIEFKKDITASDLPSNAQQINLSYKLDFVQTDEKETTEGTETTDDYENKVISWDLSDTVKMTYYDGELQPDGTYDNGTLVISGEGSIPDVTTGSDGNPTDMPVLFKLANVSSFNEIEVDESSLPILKYNPISLIIEEGITNIGTYSFAYISSLTNVTLSNTVTSIGISAFSSCSSLSNINLSNVIIIENYAFDSCSSLTNVKLLNVTTLGSHIFNQCPSLKSVLVSNKIETLASMSLADIPDGAKIYVPDEETKNKLYGYASLEKVVIDPTKFE